MNGNLNLSFCIETSDTEEQGSQDTGDGDELINPGDVCFDFHFYQSLKLKARRAVRDSCLWTADGQAGHRRKWQ